MNKAATTRLNILQKAFELIYAQGYQTTSIDDILATTQVTKGAFYYHFKNKDEMGMAIINELMKPALTNGFNEVQDENTDPLQAIYSMIENLLLKNDFLKVEFGCPAANFTQEMAPWNDNFTKALQEITMGWNKIMIAIIEKGKKKGIIRSTVNAKQVTLFVMSGYWGARNFGKLENSKKAYLPYLKELKNYLESLR